MPDPSFSQAVGAAWQAVLRRSDIRLAAFLDRGGQDDLEVLFASRSFLRLANLSPDRQMRGRPMATLLAGSPECLEALRAYRATLAGNNAIEWDCPWPGDSAGPLHRCVLIPFRASPLRGCLLAVDDRLPSAPPPREPAAERPGRNLDLTLIQALGQGAGRTAGAAESCSGDDFAPIQPGEAAEFCGRMICSQPNGAGAVVGQFGAGFGYGVAPKAAEGPCAHQAIAHGRTDPSMVPREAMPAVSRPPDVWRPERPDPRSNDAMEPEFWQAFVQIAEESGIPIDQLWREAAGDPCTRDPRSAVRTFVLRYFQLQGPNHAT